eukprot:scaffold5571_cov142-Isochrysis_galbana.AAC.5
MADALRGDAPIYAARAPARQAVRGCLFAQFGLEPAARVSASPAKESQPAQSASPRCAVENKSIRRRGALLQGRLNVHRA